MSELNFGELITTPQARDAVHVAVAPVTAEELLVPGQHIGLVPGSTTRAHGNLPHIGIVDPYLRSPVPRGAQCWLFLYPRSITNLRHSWSHPAFAGLLSGADLPMPTPEFEAAAKYIQEEANNLGLTFKDLMHGAAKFLETGDYMFTGDRDESLSDDFWHHYEVFTGKMVPADKQHSFFSCAC